MLFKPFFTLIIFFSLNIFKAKEDDDGSQDADVKKEEDTKVPDSKLDEKLQVCIFIYIFYLTSMLNF